MYKTYFQRIPETENTYAVVSELAFPSPMSELEAFRFINALNRDAETCTYYLFSK